MYLSPQHYRRVYASHSPAPVIARSLNAIPDKEPSLNSCLSLYSTLPQSLRPRTLAPPILKPSLQASPLCSPEWSLCSRSLQHYQRNAQAPVACDWRAAWGGRPLLGLKLVLVTFGAAIFGCFRFHVEASGGLFFYPGLGVLSGKAVVLFVGLAR